MGWMNMNMQNKLMSFFFLVIILMNLGTLFIYGSGQKSINQYDDILERFLILNEISQTNNQLEHLFRQYLVTRSDELLEKYEYHKSNMLVHQEKFRQTIANENELQMSKNYYHMISYLLNRMELAFETFVHPPAPEHFQYREEVNKVSSWINDTTLQFINSELTDYHQFQHAIIVENENNLSFVIGSTVLLFLASLLFTYMFCKKMTDPVLVLAEQAREIAKGNFEVEDVTTRGNDEIGVLSDTFNRMKRNIHKLIEEIRKKAAVEVELHEQKMANMQMNTLLKEMELRSLQNQMNPHFLFNTLNTVSKMAYIEGAEKSCDLIVSISRLLRYNLRPIDRHVSLQDEMNHVKDYFDIQKSRFNGRVSFEMKINSDHLSLPLPLLTLQPLIENACIHGIDSMEEGAVIGINVFDTPEHVLVEVYDNGVGMDESTVQRVMDKQEEFTSQEGDTTGIGLSNVLQRLKLFYQEERVMEIQSKPGDGTVIRLKLPIRHMPMSEVE